MLFQVSPWLLILQSALGGSPDYVLPDAGINNGRVIVVKSDVGRAGMTVRATQHQLIDGQETFSIASGQAAGFQARSNSWKVVSAYAPAGAAGAHDLLSLTHSDTIPVAVSDNAVIVGGTVSWESKTLPNCTDTGGQHLNYSDIGNNFTCGTSSSGGGGSVTEAEIDFDTCGDSPQTDTCVRSIIDASVTTSSLIVVTQSGAAATGRDQDENEMDLLVCHANPATGSFDITCRGQDGPTHGKFKLNYIVG